MALLTRKTVVAVKAETTPGTAVSTSTADAAFNIFEAGFTADVEQYERNPFRQSVGRRTSIAGVRTGTVSFTTELVGSGSLATAPPFAGLLAPCGFKEHVVTKIAGSISGDWAIGDTASQTGGSAGSGTVVYFTTTALYLRGFTGTHSSSTAYTNGSTGTTGTSPTKTEDAGFAYLTSTAPSTYSSTDIPTATVDMYNDGIKHRLVGARGNATFRVVTGQPVQVAVELTGPKAASANATLIAPTYPTNTPPTLLGANFKVQDFAGVIDNLEINTGNEIAVRRSANATSGVVSSEIVSRAVTGSIDPEATVISGTGSHDWFGKLESNTTGMLECTVSAGAGGAGNQFVLIGGQVQYSGVSVADRNGIAINQVDLAFNEGTAGDGEMIVLAI